MSTRAPATSGRGISNRSSWPPGYFRSSPSVRPEERRAAEAAVDRRPREDEGVLHVVPFVREDGDDEVLAGRPLGEVDVPHRLRAEQRRLRVVQQVAPGVGPPPVVHRLDAERLLGHRGAHRVPRGGVVLGVGDEPRADAEHQVRVDLEVRVGPGEERRAVELVTAAAALDEGRLALLAGGKPADVRARERPLALGAALGVLVRLDGDEGVLFLLGVGPLDLPLADEVGVGEGPPAEVVEVGAGDLRDAVLDDDERAAESARVAVDDDLVHLLVVADVDLVRLVAERRGEGPGAPAVADLADEVDRVRVETDQVPVDVDPGGPLPLRGALPGTPRGRSRGC